jgi:hypothetical protein
LESPVSTDPELLKAPFLRSAPQHFNASAFRSFIPPHTPSSRLARTCSGHPWRDVSTAEWLSNSHDLKVRMGGVIRIDRKANAPNVLEGWRADVRAVDQSGPSMPGFSMRNACLFLLSSLIGITAAGCSPPIHQVRRAVSPDGSKVALVFEEEPVPLAQTDTMVFVQPLR